MTEGELTDILKQALWIATAVSLPLLTAALIVGLIVGLVQALTSIQELTITFVPKLAAILIVFWITLDASGRLLVTFFQRDLLAMITRI